MAKIGFSGGGIVKSCITATGYALRETEFSFDSTSQNGRARPQLKQHRRTPGVTSAESLSM